MRRASWQNGSEMAFPMLFGHLAFQTHRCWCVFMRKAFWYGAESWRMFYGQQLPTAAKPSEPVAYTLPEGGQVTLEGWRTEQRDGETVYVGAGGQETDWIGHAYEMYKLEQDRRTQQGGTLAFVAGLLDKLTPGNFSESALRTTFSQLDDWHHRGEHPILRGMNLYEYSTWVYRHELPPFASSDTAAQPSKRCHLDIPFDDSYAPGRTWVQRVAQTPRVPRLEGIRFETDANPEMHYLVKSLLFRPLCLPSLQAFQSPERPEGTAARKASDLRILQMYEQLCTAPAGGAAWPAQSGGPGIPGPFQRGFTAFLAEEETKAAAAVRKRVTACVWPSLWDTVEVHAALAELADAWDATDATGGVAEPAFKGDTAGAAHVAELIDGAQSDRLTASEYYALRVTTLVRNFDGIAAASHEKPKRRIEDDAHVKEEPLFREGGDGEGPGLDQVEAADEMAKAGLAKLGASATIAHRFEPDQLERIMAFDTRDRTTAYSKDLLEAMPAMREGSLPSPSEDAALEQRRKDNRKDVAEVYGSLDRQAPESIGLAGVDAAPLAALLGRIEERQSARAQGVGDDEAEDDEVPPPEVAAPTAPNTEATAHFAPSDRWRRPSDYIKHMMGLFEQGLTAPKGTTPKGGKPKKKTLSRDQVCFLSLFANACNSAWEEERDDVPVERRKTRHLLLIGQGGSGKTAIVQEIVLPAIDFIFPPEPSDTTSSLMACASWAQAENLSTEVHKAVSCHNAAGMRVGGLRNRDMIGLTPATKVNLQRRWNSKRCLVVEEVSMMSPALFNMLLYRSWIARKDGWAVREERLYDKLDTAFGRMPIVIYLGDFLQLRPVAGRSLLVNLQELADGEKEMHPEHQMAVKLFQGVECCCELQGTMRFQDNPGGHKLRDLVAFMRQPKAAGSKEYALAAESWRAIQARGPADGAPEADPRMRSDKFQRGHMLAIYWETVGRWALMRAKRDALALRTPLYLLQAADRAEPPMSRDDAAKLMNHYNPHETGGMHGLLGVHVGMRVRLTEHLDKAHGLVKDAEGIVVRVEVDPRDQESVDAAAAAGAGKAREVYLRHLPLGIWLRMDKLTNSPCVEVLEEERPGMFDSTDTDSLYLLLPSSTILPFKWREYAVHRTGFPLTHGAVRTSTACQGKTLRHGVIVDCARRESGAHPMEEEDWWLHLYVMLSRATSLDDLLLLRAPDADFLLRGPPADLRVRLAIFARRVRATRTRAEALARSLGFEDFLR